MRLEGRLYREQGNWDEARASLERSIGINREFGESVSLAEALQELGRLLHQTGEPSPAMDALQEAERIFAKAGATLDLKRVRKELEGLDA
jgi:tetratricopeptide (TPR) repeat protein